MNTVQNSSLARQTKKITEGSAINTAELDKLIAQLSRSADDNAIDRVIALYNKSIVKQEQKIWQHTPSNKEIKQYHESFRVIERLHELKTCDNRHDFKIVIPVADRPQHLKQCLNSLLTLCQNYQYGGLTDNSFRKISVLIADDSRHENNIKLHKKYCTKFTAAGLNTEYFGLSEQLDLVNSITTEHAGLAQIISDTSSIDNISDFSHKGASIMRNITYLKLNRDISDDNTLIYFIDSDQEFCISTVRSDKQYAINYFHYLNEIFSTQDIAILTGKVVGDPPVSPSVMAGNFQQDILNFLNSIKNLNPEQPCLFHQQQKNDKDDAAYHDMANLFGFSNNEKIFNYHCSLKNRHDNAECFHDFSDKLNHFFYGEHPTRKTYFNYEEGFTKTTTARTVYTGNYIIKTDALNYFIPFASLKLRMAGPVLGRILKSRLKHRFVSANLPMLHNRTVASTGTSEFRPGVEDNDTDIDLSNEFIRQFYGDVLLFSMEEITNTGIELEINNKLKIKGIIEQTYQTIKNSYAEKHHLILQLKTQLGKTLNDQNNWWNKSPAKSILADDSLSNFNTFLNNIQKNFGENTDAYHQINCTEHAQNHLDELFHAIMSYQDELSDWQKSLDS